MVEDLSSHSSQSSHLGYAYDTVSDMKRNLLLVHPPQRGLMNGFANGLVDLANYVSSQALAARVSILDLALTPSDELAGAASTALDSLGPHPVIGITTTTASYQAALEVARTFKSLSPNSLIILGGHHASPEYETILRHHHTFVDAVICGEGERPLAALVRGDAPSDVAGCAVWLGDRVQANPPGPVLSPEELDTLPVTFQGFPFNSAPGKFDHATYLSARGCPLGCAFCAVAGQAIRAKSVPRVIEDLRQLVTEYGYRRIAIEDNFFAQSPARVRELCEAIARLQAELAEPFTWDCQTRVESMRSPETRDAFARANCEAVYLGVESLIEEELLFLGKTPQPDRYLGWTTEVCEAILAQPYECYINLQVGLPGEDPPRRALRLERLSELGRMAARNHRQITVFPMLHVIYPGTRHCQEALAAGQFGAFGRDIFEAFTAWEAHEEPILRFLGENFAHGVGGIPMGIMDPEAMRDGQLRIRDDAVHELRAHLDAVAALDGIHLFKYGAYLVSPALAG